MEKTLKEKLQQYQEDKKFLVNMWVEEAEEDINKKFDLEEIEYNDILVNKNKRKLINRGFVIKLLAGVSIVSLLAGGMYIAKNKPWLTDEEKLVYDLTCEADVHGGAKNETDDQYAYHSSDEDCILIGEGTAKDKLIYTCIENELSDEVTSAILERFEKNLEHDYEGARKINPSKIYEEEQEKLKERDNSYGM